MKFLKFYLLTWVAWIATEAQAHFFCKSVKDDRVQLGMYLLVQPAYDKYINTYIRLCCIVTERLFQLT